MTERAEVCRREESDGAELLSPPDAALQFFQVWTEINPRWLLNCSVRERKLQREQMHHGMNPTHEDEANSRVSPEAAELWSLCFSKTSSRVRFCRLLPVCLFVCLLWFYFVIINFLSTLELSKSRHLNLI